MSFKEGSSLQVIDDYHSMRILLYLNEHGQSVRTVVYAQASNSWSTAKPRIDRMIESGLIDEIEEEHPPKRKWVSLTEKGRNVAKHLLELEIILEGK